MALSPLTVDTSSASVVSTMPSRTYAFNFDTGEFSGFVDGVKALEQFAVKAIMTARYRYPIYDFDYGCEIEDIIGQEVSASLLISEIPRVIREALICDDRVLDVNRFEITRDSDNLFVSFFVDAEHASMPVEVAL